MQNFYIDRSEGFLCALNYQGDEPNVVIPARPGLRILADQLFLGHTEIVSVQIPDSVTDIGEFVFDGCVALREIRLPAGLRSLWGHSFARCGIEEITLPDGLTDIPPFAFKDCKALRRVVCSTGMKRIHAWAFGGCERLTEVVCGPDVEISPDAYRSLDRSGQGAKQRWP